MESTNGSGDRQVAKAEATELTAEIKMKVLTAGDLADLTPRQRLMVLEWKCREDNVPIASRPYDFIKLPDGRVNLYPNKNWAAAKRAELGISDKIVSMHFENEVFLVQVHAWTRTGQETDEYGCVGVGKDWKPDYRANKVMHAVTKAKRRATLSLAGRGDNDESEMMDVPGAERVEIDHETGEIKEPLEVEKIIFGMEHCADLQSLINFKNNLAGKIAEADRDTIRKKWIELRDQFQAGTRKVEASP